MFRRMVVMGLVAMGVTVWAADRRGQRRRRRYRHRPSLKDRHLHAVAICPSTA